MSLFNWNVSSTPLHVKLLTFLAHPHHLQCDLLRGTPKWLALILQESPPEMLVIWTCVLLTLTPAFSMAVSPNTVAFLELARLRSATTHAASPESAGGHAASIPYPGTMDDALLASALSSAVQATLSSATTTARPAVQQTLQSGEQAVISGAPKLQAGFQIAVTDLPHSLASSSAAAADVAGLAPALAPDAADRLPATSPALGATAGGALKVWCWSGGQGEGWI